MGKFLHLVLLAFIAAGVLQAQKLERTTLHRENRVLKLTGPSSALRSDDANYWSLDDAAASYSGGTGTEADPYLISTPEELIRLCADAMVAGEVDSSDMQKVFEGVYFKQTADIDLSRAYFNNLGIGVNAYFSGNYDGNGYAIKGYKVNIESTDSLTDKKIGIGLFINVSDATLKNITMEDAEVEATYSYLRYYAILCGLLATEIDNTTIENCSASGNIQIKAEGESLIEFHAGGLVSFSWNECVFNQCHAEVSITLYAHTLENSTYTGQGFIEGAGIVAQAMGETELINCTSNIAIDVEHKGTTGDESYVYSAGLAGWFSSGQVAYCSSEGTLRSTATNGGDEELADVHAAGLIDEFGNTTLTGCYSACELEATLNGSDASIGKLVFLAHEEYTLQNCYYDSDLSPADTENDEAARTTEEMQSEDFISLINATPVEGALQWRYEPGSYPVLDSQVDSETPTAAGKIEKSAISFRTMPGAISITTEEPTAFAAYTFQGVMQAIRQIPAGTTTVELPANLYILKIGDETYKVRVK